MGVLQVHDLQTHVTGLFDAGSGMPHKSLEPLIDRFTYTCAASRSSTAPRLSPTASSMHAWLMHVRVRGVHRYGFSFLYRASLFPTFSFMDTSWGEDQDILARVLDAGRTLALHRDLTGICLHNQHGENCSRSLAQVVVSRRLLEASPLGPLLDALPVIGRALARRGHTADGGQYTERGQRVTVASDVAGGLFVWSEQLKAHGDDGDATVEAFTAWLWSGNGFSKERYAKLGLARPKPPDEYLKKKVGRARAAHPYANTRGTLHADCMPSRAAHGARRS